MSSTFGNICINYALHHVRNLELQVVLAEKNPRVEKYKYSCSSARVRARVCNQSGKSLTIKGKVEENV